MWLHYSIVCEFLVIFIEIFQSTNGNQYTQNSTFSLTLTKRNGNILCPIGSVYQISTQKCIKLNTEDSKVKKVKCPKGFYLNEKTQSCVLDLSLRLTMQAVELNVAPSLSSNDVDVVGKCPLGMYWNCTLNECVAPDKCPPGQIFNIKDAKCVKTHRFMECEDAEKVYNYLLGKCIPRKRPTCPQQKIWNYTSGQCELICLHNFYFNYQTLQCVKIGHYLGCPKGTQVDYYLKKCIKSVQVIPSKLPECPTLSYYNQKLQKCVAEANYEANESPKCPGNSTFSEEHHICYTEGEFVPEQIPNCPNQSIFHAELHRCIVIPVYKSDRAPKPCPTECYVDNHLNKCVCPSKSYPAQKPKCPLNSTFDEKLEKCRISPSVTNLSSVAKCNDNFVYNELTKKCDMNRAPEINCPRNSIFDKDLQTCTHLATKYHELSAAKCPPGFYLSLNAKKCISMKLPQCPEGSVFDSTLAQCVANVIQWKVAKKKCSSGFVYNNTLSKCVYSLKLTMCPPGTVFNVGAFKCESEPVLIPGLKIYRCPELFFFDAENNQCVSYNYTLSKNLPPECPAGFILDYVSSQCLSVYNIRGRKSVPICPTNFTFSNEQHICVSNFERKHKHGYVRCPPNFEYHSVLQRCVNLTPQIRPSETPKCHSDDFVFDPNIGNCVTRYQVSIELPKFICPDGFIFVPKYGKCFSNFVKLPTEYKICISEFYYNETLQRCIPLPCPDGYYFNDVVLHCVAKTISILNCPHNYMYDEQLGRCVLAHTDKYVVHGIVPCPPQFVHDSRKRLCIFPDSEISTDSINLFRTDDLESNSTNPLNESKTPVDLNQYPANNFTQQLIKLLRSLNLNINLTSLPDEKSVIEAIYVHGNNTARKQLEELLVKYSNHPTVISSQDSMQGKPMQHPLSVPNLESNSTNLLNESKAPVDFSNTTNQQLIELLRSLNSYKNLTSLADVQFVVETIYMHGNNTDKKLLADLLWKYLVQMKHQSNTINNQNVIPNQDGMQETHIRNPQNVSSIPDLQMQAKHIQNPLSVDNLDRNSTNLNEFKAPVNLTSKLNQEIIKLLRSLNLNINLTSLPNVKSVIETIYMHGNNTVREHLSELLWKYFLLKHNRADTTNQQTVTPSQDGIQEPHIQNPQNASVIPDSQMQHLNFNPNQQYRTKTTNQQTTVTPHQDGMQTIYVQNLRNVSLIPDPQTQHLNLSPNKTLDKVNFLPENISINNKRM